MDLREGIAVIDRMLVEQTGRHLNEVQIILLQGTWEGKSYEAIAAESNYTTDYLKKDIGPKLWQHISAHLNRRVGKLNFRSVAESLICDDPIIFIHKERSHAQYFTEDLGNGIGMDMILVPAGRFLMGSPEDEPERSESEGPQHWVSVPRFFMGRYPVTQAQWQAVASLPLAEQELDPAPSRFKGANRPVEQVSWYDAIEFCQRLAQHSKRPYRLPSEAEWEYACRAKTTTPFFFGKSISADVANYDSRSAFAEGPTGEYRKETTPVGSFFANAFGLWDMHGNVDEWCSDPWHRSYKGAPTDGRVWIEGGDGMYKTIRGGSWDDPPRHCRSACRGKGDPNFARDDLGFRVCCSVPKTVEVN